MGTGDYLRCPSRPAAYHHSTIRDRREANLCVGIKGRVGIGETKTFPWNPSTTVRSILLVAVGKRKGNCDRLAAVGTLEKRGEISLEENASTQGLPGSRRKWDLLSGTALKGSDNGGENGSGGPGCLA